MSAWGQRQVAVQIATHGGTPPKFIPVRIEHDDRPEPQEKPKVERDPEAIAKFFGIDLKRKGAKRKPKRAPAKRKPKAKRKAKGGGK